MHNSLTIREQLRAANRREIFTRFRDPYRGMTISHGVAEDDDVRLAGDWQLLVGSEVTAEVAEVLRSDLDALWRRLNLCFCSEGEESGHVLELRVREDLKPRDARLTVASGRIVLEGGDVAGLWAAVMWLAWELRVRRAPLLKPGCRMYSALWKLQISQGPLGGNYSVPDLGPDFLSDASLRLYAHSGVNSMMIYGDLLCYSKSQILPELDHPEADRHLAVLVEAGKRAARYGLGFTYVPVHPKLAPDHPVFLAHPDVRGRGYCNHGHHFHFLCSSHDESTAFYAEQYERLFAAVPQLQGVLAITYSESFYHCDMWDAFEVAPCPHCQSLSPDERVIPLLNAVDRAIRRANPYAFLAEWIYSYPSSDDAWRSLRDIHATRQNSIGMCHAVDKDSLYDGRTIYQKPGYRKSIWDYSLEVEEPTEYAKSAAQYAHEDNRVFIAKTETGIGIETMQLPYVPALPHLARKWEGVRRLRPDGVHQAWLFYGHHHSRAERLAAWAVYRENQPARAFLEELARADFGPAAASGVLTCWSRFGRAIKHLPCVHLGPYYQSPSFFGPCYPFFPESAAPVPEIFHVSLYYLQEHGRTFSPRQIEDCRVSMTMDQFPATPSGLGIDLDPGLGWEVVVEEYAQAAREGRLGWEALAAVADDLESPQDRHNWEEEMALAELTWRTFLSCEHAVRFLDARRRWEETGDGRAWREMTDAARDEMKNAKAALPIYKAAPWLDPSARVDGIFPPAADCIAEKCRIIASAISERA